MTYITEITMEQKTHQKTSKEDFLYDDLDEEHGDELAVKTTEKRRAFIFTDKVSFDITEPIDFLMQD